MKQKLKSNFIYNFISQVLTLVVPLITAPYIARVLHETGNGQISYCGSIVTYFVLLANLGLNIYGQREIAKCVDYEEKRAVFWEIVVLRFFLTAISLSAFYGIFFSIGYGASYNLIILCLSIQILSCVFDIQFYFQGEENFKSIAIRSIILRSICLVSIFVFVRSENDTWIYALCLSLSMLLSNLIMWPSALKKLGFIRVSRLRIRRHIIPTILIFLPTLAITVYAVFDKTMIGMLSKNPDYDNGCYEQAYKLNSVSLLLVTIISPVLSARNSRDFKSGNNDAVKDHISKACQYVWLIGLPMIAGLIVLAPNLSSWFLGDGYREVPVLLIIMSLRYIFSGFSEIFGTQLFIPIGKEKYTTIATSTAAILNISLNFLLIPFYGAVGAAITTAVSEFVVCFVLYCFAIKTKYVSKKMVFAHSLGPLVSSIFMGVLLFSLHKFFDYSVWSFIVMVIIGFLFYYCLLLLLNNDFVKFYSKYYLDKIKKSLFAKK